jgi:PPK2 family polyphosphate:nucleotide phosphotransferase
MSSPVKLDKISSQPPKGITKEKIKSETEKLLSEIDELQNLLYASAKYSLLIVLQGMDASGKDGTIRNVFGHFNPQGIQVHSFKVPTAEELSRDFLWRIHKNVPAKGMIQIFNRSHYEDILVTRVHKLIDYETAKERMYAINQFEQLLYTHNNTHILKFYLHISHEEQQKRLQERLDDRTKQWKYSESDISESQLWNSYMEVYEDAINNCNAIPWIVTPSDRNWYKEYIVAKEVHRTLKNLKMRYPGLKK